MGARGTNLSSGEQWGGGGRGTNLSSGEQCWGPVGPISALVSSGGGGPGGTWDQSQLW